MAGWYNKVSDNLSNIIDCIDYYEAELAEAKKECYIKGNVERNSAALPGITEHRFNQLQEIEAILEYLNIEQRRKKTKYYKKYLEGYNKALSSRDAEKYADGEDEVIDQQHIVNEFALIRNKYLGLIKALDAKQFQINNIVKLRAAGLEDVAL